MNASNQDQMNCLLFAAGLGTRLKPFTLAHPKPTLPLFQIPLGYYVLPYLKNLNLQNTVVNTFHLPDQIESLYIKTIPDVQFSHEKNFIRGSAGGIKLATKYFEKQLPLLTINADEVFFAKDPDFIQKALDLHIKNQALATLVVCRHPEAGHKFGGIWTNQNKVVHIGKEKPNQSTSVFHFLGLQIINPQLFPHLNEQTESNIFYDVLIHKLNTDLVQVFEIDCDWYEVGNLQDYLSAKNEIKKRKDTDSVYINHFKELANFPKTEMEDLHP